MKDTIVRLDMSDMEFRRAGVRRFVGGHYFKSDDSRYLVALPITYTGKSMHIKESVLLTLNSLFQKGTPYLLVTGEKEGNPFLDVVPLKTSSRLFKSASVFRSIGEQVGSNFAIVLSSKDDKVLYSRVILSSMSAYSTLEKCNRGMQCDAEYLIQDIDKAYINKSKFADKPELVAMATFIDELNGSGYTPDTVVLEFVEDVLRGIVIYK